MFDHDPKPIVGLLDKFKKFIPTERRVRMTIQSFIENRLELRETIQKNEITCTGKIIYIRTNPYLKQEIVAHTQEILNLLRDREQLYFDSLR